MLKFFRTLLDTKETTEQKQQRELVDLRMKLKEAWESEIRYAQLAIDLAKENSALKRQIAALGSKLDDIIRKQV